MRIDFDDEEYPELSRYLENPKRRMKFLYFLEELFTENSFDPAVDGFVLLNQKKQQIQQESGINAYLETLTATMTELAKKLDGSVIGRFPTEQIVREVVKEVPVREKKKDEEEEIDYSSTEGIDFSQAIAMFED